MNAEKEQEIQELIDKLVPYTETDTNNSALSYLDALLEFANWHRDYSEESDLFNAICKELTENYDYYSTNYDIVQKECIRTTKYTTIVPKELSE
jgi:hypothetical protein